MPNFMMFSDDDEAVIVDRRRVLWVRMVDDRLNVAIDCCVGPRLVALPPSSDIVTTLDELNETD